MSRTAPKLSFEIKPICKTLNWCSVWLNNFLFVKRYSMCPTFPTYWRLESCAQFISQTVSECFLKISLWCPVYFCPVYLSSKFHIGMQSFSHTAYFRPALSPTLPTVVQSISQTIFFPVYLLNFLLVQVIHASLSFLHNILLQSKTE